MPAFVLEIGVEELPARFLLPVQKELFEAFNSAFSEKNLDFSGLSVMATPRRLVVMAEHIAELSQEKEELVVGPSVKAAYDVGGRPTRAAEGFAKTHGLSLEHVFNHETEKGVYIAVRKKTGGEKASDILSLLCPAIISGLSFPKKMKWASGSFTFARPLRWILALLGEDIIPFSLAGLHSGNVTHGHRVHGPGPFTVEAASRYLSVITEQGKVTVSGSERLAVIKEKGNALAAAHNGIVLWNDNLLEEVQGLCEHPVPLLGGFDSVFLELPPEVLLTSMQVHQKSFGVQAESGNLLPFFLTVSNITPQDPAIVRKGWERVLRARLEDARFFWKNDLAAGFKKWLEDLEHVIYLAPLGTMADKTRRIAELSGWLANNVHYVNPTDEKVKVEDAIRAGRLSKADLVSEMVKEFDTLQGTMGGIYAGMMGEPEPVAQAISEQYLPAGPDSPVPSTLGGALLSIADKADTLVGCFGLGMIPTGAADPYGLRRAALGIARILLEKNLRVSISALFAKAQEVYGSKEWKLEPDQSLARLEEFFSSRLKNYFIAEGAETLFVEAVLASDADDAWAAHSRLSALKEFSDTEGFASCVQTFKRVANILKKNSEGKDNAPLTGEYSRELLQEKEEIALADKLAELYPVLASLWDNEQYGDLFARLGELRPDVDAFFDSIMVMCDDLAVRENRLNLLQALLLYFERLADFSCLQM